MLGIGLAMGMAQGGCADEGSTTAEPSASAAKVEPTGEAVPEATKCPEARVPLATRLGAKITETCEAAAAKPDERDPEIDRRLRGHWRGEYDGDSSGPVSFQAELEASDGTISGSTTEPNTFSYVYGYSELEAGLTGDAYASGRVVLLKTYRTGSATHSVLYVGTLDEAGRRIEGHWRLGAARGTFWLTKD